MQKKQRATLAVALLKQTYPEAICSLEYTHPYELVIATRLSAQCTDARVNIVTRELFVRYPTLEAFAHADLGEMEQMVRPCGFYKVKAKDIIALSRMLLDEFQDNLPNTVETLCLLPGVGRKTANLIVGDIFKKPAIVCDTHCIRITNLLGLTTSKDPAKVEEQLRTCLAPEESNDFCHRCVLHGREYCKARSPRCQECPIAPACKHFEKTYKLPK